MRWEDNIKMDLQEVGWGHGLDFSGSGEKHVAGSFDCGNKPSGYIKCGEFIDKMKTWLLLRKGSAPWS